MYGLEVCVICMSGRPPMVLFTAYRLSRIVFCGLSTKKLDYILSKNLFFHSFVFYKSLHSWYCFQRACIQYKALTDNIVRAAIKMHFRPIHCNCTNIEYTSVVYQKELNFSHLQDDASYRT